MKHKHLLLTGSSGNLGRAIVKSGYFSRLLTPSEEDMDITIAGMIEEFFTLNEFDAVIHCAALARMKECEIHPQRAVRINIAGTCNLVQEVLKKEKDTGKKIRFIYISTDGVYPGQRGDYSEKDETLPYNRYGWTKLGGECAVKMLQDHCIIRTSFFDPENIPFDTAATDAYSSRVPLDYLTRAIATIFESGFTGTINIGGEKKSEYERYKEFKPQIKPCKLKDILKEVPFPMASDASMDTSLWKELESKQKPHG